MVFSPDSKHLAYSGEWNHTPMAVLDGVALHTTADMVEENTDLLFSPDGNRFGFATYSNVFVEGGPVKRHDPLAVGSVNPASSALAPTATICLPGRSGSRRDRRS